LKIAHWPRTGGLIIGDWLIVYVFYIIMELDIFAALRRQNPC
jgi:hypothetical protein